MRAVFLGTGTNVGKTYAVSRLARRAAKILPNAAILCLKPIESGLEPADPGAPPPGSDAAILSAACFRAEPPIPHPRYAYPAPLSPYAAARHNGVLPDIAHIAEWTARAEASAASRGAAVCSLIETAGGVFSPLTASATNLDLAHALEPARWIVVAPNSLGVLHAATATCLAMQARGRAPDALLLTQPTARDASSSTNASLLREAGVAPAVIELCGVDPGPLDALIALMRGAEP